MRWRGIEATLALAQSPNTKIVIIGTNKDGLPIILGNDAPAAPNPAPQPGANGGTLPPPGAPPGPKDKTSSGAPSAPPAETGAQTKE